MDTSQKSGDYLERKIEVVDSNLEKEIGHIKELLGKDVERLEGRIVKLENREEKEEDRKFEFKNKILWAFIGFLPTVIGALLIKALD